jgi:formylglycine-generating enzyme required for sulfatase activity
MEQYHRFLNDPDYSDDEKPTRRNELIGRIQQAIDSLQEPRKELDTSNYPVFSLNWYDAILFCNWLSYKEGLAVCYERTGEKEKHNEHEYDGWRLIPDAGGYRLPTEAEWEYACRAGTVTSYCFGEDVALLDQYSVYRESLARECGSKLPNGWGLFDLHGNVYEWCEDGFGPFQTGEEVIDPLRSREPEGDRVMRGGACVYLAPRVTSWDRREGNPHHRYFNIDVGCRVVRTLGP